MSAADFGRAVAAIGGRKYSLAVWFALVGALALFTGHLTGTQFLSLAGLVLALFGAANVGQKVGLARTEPETLP